MMGDSSEPTLDPVLAADQSPAPAPEDQQTMHIHKIKPVHGWKEFLNEIAIIVVGVLIALSLEQAVEALHEQRVRQEAREAVRDEAGQNLFWANARERREPCFRQRLAEISSLLDRAGRHELFPVAQHIKQPIHIKITAQVWDANAQAGRTSLFTTEEQRNFGNLYFTTSDLKTSQSAEDGAWAKLGALRGRGALSQAAVDSLWSSLAEARFYNLRSLLSIRRAQEWAKLLHLSPTTLDVPGTRSAIGRATCSSITEKTRISNAKIDNQRIWLPEDEP